MSKIEYVVTTSLEMKKNRTQFCGLRLTEPPKDENLVRIAEQCEDSDGWIKVDSLFNPSDEDWFQLNYDGIVTVGWFNSGDKTFCSEYLIQPTHYKPLSKPPKQ